MFKDNLLILIAILVAIVASVAILILSAVAIPVLILWTIILCIYYPYCKLIKRFFPNSKVYWRCWRRLYRYCHIKESVINNLFDNGIPGIN